MPQFLVAHLAVAAILLAQGGGPAVATVPRVDLRRYAGAWYEIARLPNRFQRDCSADVRAEYALRDDGLIDVVNSCATARGERRRAQGVARVVRGSEGAKLEVRFAPAFLSVLPFVWGDYWVIGLAADYSWAVVGSPDRQYLWLLARTPRLETATVDAALAIARQNGFDLTPLVRSGSRLVDTP